MKRYNKIQMMKYLTWTFLLAYAIQIGASFIYNNGNTIFAQLIITGMMFVPTIGALISGVKLDDMGWKVQFRKNLRFIMIAWLAPIVLVTIGASLYFMIFPTHFDISGKYLVVTGGVEAIKKMESLGISYPLYIIMSFISSITYAPFVNMVIALGEEIGWRGFLYPQLKAKLGRRKGWIIGGIIWGMWHWPLIWLVGYEYGAATANQNGYIGFPIVGMLLFCVITVGWGILHDWLYEKSESIWIPSLFHGAINAVAALPLSVCLTNTGSARLLGPAPMGVLAALPFLLVAIVLLLRQKNS